MGTKTTGKKTETVKETAEEVKAVEEATALEEPKLLMYVGPTMTKYGVIQNVIYDGLPEIAANMIGKIPLFKSLFVDPAMYPEAEKSIRLMSGHYWAAYQAAVNYKEDR